MKKVRPEQKKRDSKKQNNEKEISKRKKCGYCQTVESPSLKGLKSFLLNQASSGNWQLPGNHTTSS